MAQTAKLFWSGRSQAVRLPKEFRLVGNEVRIRKEGAAVILEPLAADWQWLDDIAGKFSEDFLQDGRWSISSRWRWRSRDACVGTAPRNDVTRRNLVAVVCAPPLGSSCEGQAPRAPRLRRRREIQSPGQPASPSRAARLRAAPAEGSCYTAP